METPDLFASERPLLARGEIVVGVDEVGRGALAGPMTVGAVVVESDRPFPAGLTDSKRLRPAQREALVAPITSWATSWSLGWVSAGEIDTWGLRLALAVAATRALEGLTMAPSFALLDGSFNLLDAPLPLLDADSMPPPLRFAHLTHLTLVKGDQRSATIAAASVLAKVARDAHMRTLGERDERFGWASNKGYGAAAHLDALRQFGPSAEHRRSWSLPTREFGTTV